MRILNLLFAPDCEALDLSWPVEGLSCLGQLGQGIAGQVWVVLGEFCNAC